VAALLRCVGQADRPARAAFERAVNHARVRQKIETGHGIANEKLVGQHVALHSIAGRACHDEVAGNVRAAVCEWVDVVDGSDRKLQRSTAVHAAAAAVAHHRALERAFFLTATGMQRFTVKPACAPREWRDDAVKSMP